jgi:hypothetical protein
MGPHPLIRRLADKGFELRVERSGPRDRIGGRVVSVRHLDPRPPDHEARFRLAEGCAGIEREPSLAGEESGTRTDLSSRKLGDTRSSGL